MLDGTAGLALDDGDELGDGDDEGLLDGDVLGLVDGLVEGEEDAVVAELTLEAQDGDVLRDRMTLELTDATTAGARDDPACALRRPSRTSG
jgi:hypothetical protein